MCYKQTELSYSNDQERTQDYINNRYESWKPTGCNWGIEKAHSHDSIYTFHPFGPQHEKKLPNKISVEKK